MNIKSLTIDSVPTCSCHGCTVDNVSQAGSIDLVNSTPKMGSSQTSLDVKDDKEAGCDTVLPCDPRRWMHRYFMLFFMCMLSFGSYYVYDNPTALQRTIQNVRLTLGGD